MGNIIKSKIFHILILVELVAIYLITKMYYNIKLLIE